MSALAEALVAAQRRALTHSVEITRNAKGVAQFEVTVRGYDLSDVLQKTQDAFSALSTALPYSNGAA